MDEETEFEFPEAATPVERVRFWHSIGVSSALLVLFGIAVVFLRLLLIFVTNDKSEPGLFAMYLGISAAASFVVGTFLADLWVVHALVSRSKPRPADRIARKMNPITSLVLTCRLGSTATDSAEKDLLFSKILLALFATLISVLLLILLWK